MYTNRVILKLSHSNPTVQRYAVLNFWSPSRKINFLQKCKDCLNAVLKSPNQKEKLCNVSESCCSARAQAEEASHGHEPTGAAVTPQRSANVVIIGAGMAGLSAANHLQDNGVSNVTVLEALDRPGGRIQSRWFGDSIIELGSPVKCKICTNPILEKVVEDGYADYTMNNADPSKGLLLRSNGSVIPYPVTFEVYQLYKEILAEVREVEKAESNQGKKSAMTLVGSRIAQEIRMFPSSYQVDAERLFHGFFSLTNTKSNHDSSLIVSNDFGDYLQLPGSDVKVPLGHFAEVDTLFNKLVGDTVVFGKSVSKIRWGGVADEFPRAIVICEDGETFQADYVIITVSLGVLKDLSNSLFCPGLPASKLNAILKIPMGFTNKVFLEFKDPFTRWYRDFSKVCFDAKKMVCKKGWMKGFCSIEPIRGSDHVICLTVAGPQAECMECMADDEIICDICDILKEISGKTEIPEPVKIKRSSWSTDPNFCGAYSYKGPNTCSQDMYDLASPLPEPTDFCDPVLLFAGEATCPIKFGTVRGAQNSGIREAERLLQLIRNHQSKQQDSFMQIACEV